MKKVVVALGGNAISEPGKRGDIDEQFDASRRTAARLADLLDRGHRVIVCHGNGPQVGNILRRSELARSEVYPIPLVLCVADSQAGMGYMIGQCVMNELAARGRPRVVTTIVTTVEVDPEDPALRKPTKPIGILYSAEQARQHERDDGWSLVEQQPGRWRRVVASPRPRAIVELDVIRALYEGSHTLVACGGGGIPVRRMAPAGAAAGSPAGASGGAIAAGPAGSPAGGAYAGIEGVIDKDLTAALLAASLDADQLVIATAVERVYEAFGTPAARALDRLTAAEAVICSLDRLADAVEGRSGTRVVA